MFVFCFRNVVSCNFGGMKRSVFVALLFLFLSPAFVRAATQIRAKPMLKQDKEYNSILLHVARYFVLTIPDDKTLGDIGYDIRCTFVIAPDGALRQLEIQNDVDEWTGMFDGAAAKRTEMWLRNAVLEGMNRVPAFDLSQLRNNKGNRKRTVVFSFGRGGGGQATNIPFMGFNSGVVDANMDQSLGQQKEDIRSGKADENLPGKGLTAKQADRLYFRQDKAWTGYTDENIKTTIKPKYEPYKHTPPKPIQSSPLTPVTPPQVEIAVSLQ